MMHRKTFLTVAASALVLVGMTGCSMLIRQNPPKPAPAPEKKAAPAPQKKQADATVELTDEQFLAMTPEQLKKYHAEKRARQEREDAVTQKKNAMKQPSAANNRKSGQDLVDSFMTDRPSREKRRRLGDVSRQLDYSETSIFPWRDGRRSESLNRRY